MKIKITSLYRYIVLILLLIENCFFYLIPLPEFLAVYMSFFIKVFVGFLSLLIFLSPFIYVKFQKKLRSYSNFAIKYAWMYLISILLAIGASVAANDFLLIDTFIIACPYFIVLMYIPILISLADERDIEILFYFMNIFSFIWYVLAIAQCLIYSASGYTFLTFLEKAIIIRNDRIRIELVPFGNLMLIYNFYTVFYRKNKRRLLHFLNFALGLFALFYVQQTRSMIIIIMACFCYFVVTENSNRSKLVKNVFLCVAGGIAIFKTGYFDRFISTFSDVNYAGSNIAREYANAYYLSVFFKNPIIGFGFTANEKLLRGNRGIAYIDDVGLIGQMARLGIFIFIIFVPIVIRWAKIAIFMKRETGSRMYIGFLIYLLATSATIMILDSQRIVLLPFLIAVFEFSYSREKAQKS